MYRILVIAIVAVVLCLATPMASFATPPWYIKELIQRYSEPRGLPAWLELDPECGLDQTSVLETIHGILASQEVNWSNPVTSDNQLHLSIGVSCLKWSNNLIYNLDVNFGLMPERDGFSISVSTNYDYGTIGVVQAADDVATAIAESVQSAVDDFTDAHEEQPTVN